MRNFHMFVVRYVQMSLLYPFYSFDKILKNSETEMTKKKKVFYFHLIKAKMPENLWN